MGYEQEKHREIQCEVKRETKRDTQAGILKERERLGER